MAPAWRAHQCRFERWNRRAWRDSGRPISAVSGALLGASWLTDGMRAHGATRVVMPGAACGFQEQKQPAVSCRCQVRIRARSRLGVLSACERAVARWWLGARRCRVHIQARSSRCQPRVRPLLSQGWGNQTISSPPWRLTVGARDTGAAPTVPVGTEHVQRRFVYPQPAERLCQGRSQGL